MSGRVEFFGCAFDRVDLPEAVTRVRRWMDASDRPRVAVGINVDYLVRMAADPAFRAAAAGADLVLADGMPVVWASRLLRRGLPERVAAIDLFEALLPVASEEGWPLYLLGARPDVLADAEAALRRRWPRLRVVGRHHGYFDDDAAVGRDIAASGARWLCVAMTSPRKERFLLAAGPLGEVRCVLGIGGTLDIAAGRTRRAPRWMRAVGVEWAFRLAQEPRRLARRYLVDDLAFFPLLWRELRGAR